MRLSPLLLTVRFGSSRLPGKCLLPFSSFPNQSESVLAHLINRTKSENRRVIVCTGESGANDIILKICKELKIEYFKGSESNKVSRWYACFKYFDLKWAHLIDADDPFLCNSEIDLSIKTFHSTKKVIVSTKKSKSGNASVGMTLSADHLARMYTKV